jgi:hypothetical protein
MFFCNAAACASVLAKSPAISFKAGLTWLVRLRTTPILNASKILGASYMKTSHRIQEWLADRVSFVQYPQFRPADQHTRESSRDRLRFKHRMPIGKRIDLFLLSLVGLMFGLAAVCAVLFFIYALLF